MADLIFPEKCQSNEFHVRQAKYCRLLSAVVVISTLRVKSVLSLVFSCSFDRLQFMIILYFQRDVDQTNSSVRQTDLVSVEQDTVTEYQNVQMALMKLVAVSIHQNICWPPATFRNV